MIRLENPAHRSSKAAAIRFFSDNVGRAVDTVQRRPDGSSWTPGPRTVARKGTRTFTLDGSTVEFTPNHRVTSVTDRSVTVEFTRTGEDPNDVRVIHTTTYTLVAERVPTDFPVKVLGPDDPAGDRATCGTCGRSWDDSISTSMTPVPAGRCPFEYYH